MAKQTSRAKPTTPVLIFRGKQGPKAFLLEAEGAAKLTEGDDFRKSYLRQ